MTIDQLKATLGNYKWTLLVALLLLVMMGFGYKLAQNFESDARKKVAAQSDTIDILSKENDQLITQVNQLEVALELAMLETKSMTKTVVEQRKELDAQQELITFYERVMAPEKSEKSFQIEGVEVFHLTGNDYQLRLVLLQSQQNKAVINGRLNIAVSGKLGNELTTLTHGDPDFITEPVKYRFRFFQVVNTTFSLPEGMQPEALSFSTAYFQYKTRKGNYELNINWAEALSTTVE
ncbi:hypothetical protein D210916BOD24_25190 [Alteromonas sp. D210916BOD_24]|uniref:DUF6776 family protein n=1 Tax=Alteromonas sp. D210916BOD_24 TaxID=3157618 RepID=UPI00399CFAFB